MTLIKGLLAVFAVGYLALVAVLYLAQRALMYFPERTRTAPAAVGLSEADEVVLDTADGERVIAWHIAPREGAPVVLYFHGNGGALQHRIARFRELTADGTGLVALSYRGYGGSSGVPTETGLLVDAATAYAFAAAARYEPARIVLWGESLGSGVAVGLAADHPVGRIVLEAPYSAAVDIAAAAYPFVPVRLLMKDQFRSDLLVGKIGAPVLILHGERDEVIPIGYGELLYSLIKSPKRFVRFRDGHHEDLSNYGAVAAAKAFLAERFE